MGSRAGDVRRSRGPLRRTSWGTKPRGLVALLVTVAAAAHCCRVDGGGEGRAPLGFTPLGFGLRSGQLLRGRVVQAPRPPPSRYPPQRRALCAISGAALRLSTLVCGVLGAGCVFAAAPGSACLHRITLAATSAFFTAFGGGTQSEVFRWALGKAARAETVRPVFGFKCPGEHLLVTSGFLIALALEAMGALDMLLEAHWWRNLISLMMGFMVAVSVARDGWFERTRHGYSLKGAWGAVSWLGTFLYAFGGGFWRDVLVVGRPPVALAAGTLFALTAGGLLCKRLRDYGDSCGGRGTEITLLAGTPAVACLFAVFA